MIKYKVNKLRSKFNINNKSSLEDLKTVVHKLGFNLSTYSEEKMKLISLRREQEIQTASSLSVIDSSGNTTIYYNGNLPPAIQRFSLAHEIGHILLGHTRRNLTDKKQEEEADKFASYLLSPQKKRKLIGLQLDCSILCLCIFISAICGFLSSNLPTSKETHNYESALQHNSIAKPPQNSTIQSSQSSTVIPQHNNTVESTPSNIQLCYFTPSGKVYHLYRDCQHIKNSKQVFTNTVQNSGKERICSTCEYREYKNKQ